MTRRQRAIIAFLAIANTLIILSVVVLVARFPATNPSPLPTPILPTEIPTLYSQPKGSPETPQSTFLTPGELLPETCQWKAAQRMAQAGLGGAVTLTAGSALHFEIIHTLAPGQAADASAQLIWTAFDVALALDGESQCDSFTQVEVTITVQQDNQANTRINASVNAADLAAFGAGELSEDEFIERVIYTVNER